MKQLALLLLLMTCARASATAQENAVIEKIEISGVAEDRLSPGLRDDLQGLQGQRFDSRASDGFVSRMQEELPEHVVAVRAISGDEADKVRLIFVVANIADDGALDSNINARYPIDAVEIEGAPRSSVSDQLYADMQKMVGQGLNNDEAEKLRERLASELGPSYSVIHKVQRSFGPNGPQVTERQLKVIYEVFRIPWLPIREPPSFVAYHGQQGFSFALGTGTGLKRRRTQNFLVGVTNNGDELIERYAGFRVGYENVRLGTDRLGIKFAYSSYRNQWSVHTISPDLYRRRRSFEASIAVAFNSNLYVTTGISASELEMQAPPVHFEPSRAGIGTIHYQRVVEAGGDTHEVQAGYEVHAGSGSLDSGFVYTRHAWNGRYAYRHDRHTVRISGTAGRITGHAPMFERFSLGNIETLRGWNKFDFAPLGGGRVVYGSFEYGFKDFQVFYDVGSVWDSGEEVKVRPSVGLGVGNLQKHEFFLGLAVPLDESGMSPAFMVVCRFSGF